MDAAMEGVTRMIEKKVDEELERVDAEVKALETMDDDDLEVLRQKRRDALKKAQEQKQEWLTNGHGQYEEVASEKDFFEATKKSKNVVAHFYVDSSFRCKIVDKHLALLAPKHIETKFLKINAEKSPFLTERLKIKVMPTICLVRDSKTVDYIVGFTDLGNRDDFSTDILEWRIATQKVINYSGDLLTPPEDNSQKEKPRGKSALTMFGKEQKKTIRGGGIGGDCSSDEDDW